ncbi:MAG: hypothetical protein ACOC5A_06890 [Halanaerobiales bacterium]
MNIKEYYDGNDLGVICRQDKTIFKVWSPPAEKVWVKIYSSDTRPGYRMVRKMKPSRDGTWKLELARNLKGLYYTYQFKIDGRVQETVDPYAVAVGTNSRRALICDPGDVNPPGWENDSRVKTEKRTDAVIYEVHVRDFPLLLIQGWKTGVSIWLLSKKAR